MNGFFLLLAHLVGDFVLQEDFQAKHKTNKHPGNRPGVAIGKDGSPILDADPDLANRLYVYEKSLHDWWRGHFACTVHCLLYTLAIAAGTCWWMPWWGYVIVLATHWPIDRFRLARVWMEHVSHQQAFANGPFSPWSVIVIDQIFHLLILGIVAMLAGQVNFSGAP